MGEGQALIGAAGELDEVKFAVVLERAAQVAALVGGEAAGLELDAVEFDAEEEAGGGGEFGADGLGDLKDQAGAVGEAAAVAVGAFVGGLGEELGEEVAVGAVQFDAVVAGFVEEFGGVGEAGDDVVDFFEGGGVGLVEVHAHDVAFELDIRGGDWVGLDKGWDLAAWMADLSYTEAAMLLCLGGEFFECFKPLSRKIGILRYDCVSCSF